MHEWSNMHKDTFARRQFYTNTLLHEESNLHEDTFAQVMSYPWYL